MGNAFHALAFSNKNCKFNLGFIKWFFIQKRLTK
jgi:hypothetical protein